MCVPWCCQDSTFGPSCCLGASPGCACTATGQIACDPRGRTTTHNIEAHTQQSAVDAMHTLNFNTGKTENKKRRKEKKAPDAIHAHSCEKKWHARGWFDATHMM